MRVLLLLVLVLVGCARSINDTELIVGDGTVADTKITSNQGLVNDPFLRYNSGTGAWQFCNDGLSCTDMGSGGGGGGTDSLIQDFTYSGAIAQGQPVYLKADGKVAKVINDAVQPAFADDAGNQPYLLFYDATNDQYVSLGNAGSFTYGIRAVTATVSGSVVTITSNTDLNGTNSVSVNSPFGCSYSYDPVQNVVVCFWEYNLTEHRAIALQINNGSVTIGTSVSISSEDVSGNHQMAEYDSANNKHLWITATTDGVTNRRRSTTLQTTGTTISNVVFTNIGGTIPNAGGLLEYVENNNKMVMVDGNEDVRIVDLSGASPSFSSPLNLPATSDLSISATVQGMHYIPSADKLLINYSSSSATTGIYAYLVDVSGATPTLDNKLQISTGSWITNIYQSKLSYVPIIDRFIQTSDGASSGNDYYHVIQVSGTTITDDGEFFFNGNAFNDTTFVTAGPNEVMFTTPNGSQTSRKFTSAPFDSGYNLITNHNAYATIGIAQEAGTDATVHPVALIGAVSGIHSGLTIGEVAYVAADGTLEYNPSSGTNDGYPIGKVIAADKIQLMQAVGQSCSFYLGGTSGISRQVGGCAQSRDNPSTGNARVTWNTGYWARDPNCVCISNDGSASGDRSCHANIPTTLVQMSFRKTSNGTAVNTAAFVVCHGLVFK